MNTNKSLGFGGQVVPGAPALPQVNLLPSDIRAGRQLRSIRPWLGIAFLATILVAGLLVVWTTYQLKAAEDDLAETQDANQQLTAQQADYAEVPRVLGQLRDLDEVRLYGMSAETMWKPYIIAIAATAPAGLSIDQMAMTFASGTEATVAPTTATGSSEPMTIGQMTFEAKSLTLPDTVTWMNGIDAIPGLANAWVESAEIADENGVIHYTVSGHVDVTADSLALRFLVDAVGEG